jgi:hypothetical protein
MKTFFRYLAAYLLLAAAALATELKIGTLNCYLLFDPAIQHSGKLDDEKRMSSAEYQTKLSNLASLIKGYQVVALQETGGRDEVTALAKAAGMLWAWTKGKDVATGEEVALLYDLPGWKVTSEGRVGELDRVVSKHLLVLATRGTDRIYFLAVHLIRPIGAQAEKQARQRTAIGGWMAEEVARDPGASVVVLGDTNDSDANPGPSLYGIGREAGELDGFAATHLIGKCFDRLVLAGVGNWTAIEIIRPPYGKRPNDSNKRVWTDHFFVGTTLHWD